MLYPMLELSTIPWCKTRNYVFSLLYLVMYNLCKLQ